MNIRKVVAVTGLALFAAAPFAANAGGASKASDACVRAFVDAYLPKNAAVRVRKSGPSSSPLRIYARQYTVALSAQLGGSEEGLVTARCVANANGNVLAFEGPGIERKGVTPGLAATMK